MGLAVLLAGLKGPDQNQLQVLAEQGLHTWLWLENCLQNSPISGSVCSPLH